LNFFKAINYSYKEEYKRIINSEGKYIGYIVLNGNLNQIKEIYNYIEENINIRMNYVKINEPNINKFYSFLLCLFNIKELYNQLTIYYNKDKQIIKILIDFIFSKTFDDKINEYFLTSIKSNDYKFIINDVFEKLNSELINENRNDFANKGNDQIEQYDEIIAKNKFFEKNKNASIIKKIKNIDDVF
jgi:hypothetical protein